MCRFFEPGGLGACGGPQGAKVIPGREGSRTKKGCQNWRGSFPQVATRDPPHTRVGLGIEWRNSRGGGRKGDTPPVTHQGSFTIYMPKFFQDKLFPPYFPPIWPMRPGVLSLHPPWYLGVSGPLSGQNESICFTTPQTPTPPTPPHNSQAIFLTMVIFRGSTSTA